jgi:methylthioribose-1-phosphate isomerase
MVIPTIHMKQGSVAIIDQRLLPGEYRIIELRSVDALCDAIKQLAIRGAPALGVAGAFGLLLAVEENWKIPQGFYFDMESENIAQFPSGPTIDDVQGVLRKASDQIAATRPTAVNLFWAIGRMNNVSRQNFDSTHAMLQALYTEALAIHDEDIEMCMALGKNGAELLADGDTVLTHCNAGGLATSGFGTALGVIFAATESGKRINVYADETRPLLQGARLTAWECTQRGIPVTIICEGMVAHVMSKGLISSVVVGADRIAANGDTANKIGTFTLALVAHRFRVPFYVAAPSSTIDLSLPSGLEIPIEQRSEMEVKSIAGVSIAPEDARANNPAFDVTPHDLITAIITEKGVHRTPFDLSG